MKMMLVSSSRIKTTTHYALSASRSNRTGVRKTETIWLDLVALMMDSESSVSPVKTQMPSTALARRYTISRPPLTMQTVPFRATRGSKSDMTSSRKSWPIEASRRPNKSSMVNVRISLMAS